LAGLSWSFGFCAKSMKRIFSSSHRQRINGGTKIHGRHLFPLFFFRLAPFRLHQNDVSIIAWEDSWPLRSIDLHKKWPCTDLAQELQGVVK
jgi:hypothetical protein